MSGTTQASLLVNILLKQEEDIASVASDLFENHTLRKILLHSVVMIAARTALQGNCQNCIPC